MGSHVGLPEAMREHGLELQDRWVISSEDPSEIENEEMLEQVTALYVVSLRLRLLPRLLGAGGLQWPESLSVITAGYGPSIPHLSNRPLTYVEVPAERVSVGAARLIADLLENPAQTPAPPAVLYGRSSLHVRHLADGSVGPPRDAVLAGSPLSEFSA